MPWAKLLADLIVVFHAAYVSFVVFGLVAILIGAALRWEWVRNFWFRASHLTMIGIVVLEALFGITCPLTALGETAPPESRGGRAIRATSSATGSIG